MDILQKSIKSLYKEEIINYKLYTRRTQSDANRKDIVLFDLMRKHNSNHEESGLIKNIYGNLADKNKYYRLKNRLHKELCNSLVQFHFYETDINAIYCELMLFNIYVDKNEWEIASYHLEKAEKKALQTNDLTLLDFIYTEKIKFASNYNFSNIKTIVVKSEANFKKLQNLKKLDFAIAEAVHELYKAQGFTKKPGNKTFSVLKKVTKNLEKLKEFKKDGLFRIRCFEGLSRVLLSQQNYIELERFSLSSYTAFAKDKLFTKNNHHTKLQMLTYICNSLFVNKKHAMAIEWIDALKQAMSEFNGLLYDRYVFFYYNSLINNYSVIDSKKAIEVLQKAKAEKSITTHPTHLGYIYLNLAGAHFDLKEYKFALKNIIELYRHKLFSVLDKGFKLKISILEIILRIELNDFDYAETLTKQLYTNYKDLAKASEYHADLGFIKTLHTLLVKHGFENTAAARAIAFRFLKEKSSVKASHIIDYKNWLRGKF